MFAQTMLHWNNERKDHKSALVFFDQDRMSIIRQNKIHTNSMLTCLKKNSFFNDVSDISSSPPFVL